MEMVLFWVISSFLFVSSLSPEFSAGKPGPHDMLYYPASPAGFRAGQTFVDLLFMLAMQPAESSFSAVSSLFLGNPIQEAEDQLTKPAPMGLSLSFYLSRLPLPVRSSKCSHQWLLGFPYYPAASLKRQMH